MATISVIVPLYNKREELRGTIKSVLNQTYKDFEVIIIDDGSNDNSLSTIQDICDKRISIYKQDHMGVSHSRNLGIEKARGRFIVFLDADDELNSDFLTNMINLAKSYPECHMFASNYKFRDNLGQESIAKIRRLKLDGNIGILDYYFKVASHSHPPLCIGNTMIRRDTLLDKTYYFDERVCQGEDLIFWSKLAAQYKIAYTKDVLMTYNISSFPLGNETKNNPNEKDVLFETLRIIKSNYKPKYISSYIAQCKKMLVATLTRRGLRFRAIKEALLGLRYDLSKWELYLYIIWNITGLSKGKLDVIQRRRYLKC